MARRRQLVAPRERETPTPVRRTASPLVVGAAGDAAEREADRVADQVLTRLRGGEAHDHDCSAHRGHDVSRTPSTAPVGAEVGRDGGEISADLSSRIEAGRSGGTALSGDVRERMEAGFGESLGDVRIHTGSESADLNRSVSARAFTVGRDVFFGQGEYRPDTPEGERVLAHEIAHTRQEGAAARRTIRRWDLRAPNLDLGQTQSVGVVSSGQEVFFLEDASGDKLVLKSERFDNRVGLSELGADLHLRLSGVQSARHRKVSQQDLTTMLGLLDDRGRLDRESWERLGKVVRATRREVTAQAGEGASDLDLALFHQKLQVRGRPANQWMMMSFVEGDTAGSLGQGQDNDAYGQEKTKFRRLMSDRKHVKELGLLTAVDLFFGNADRVYQGNVGNWMYHPLTEAMTLIDHVDSGVKDTFTAGHSLETDYNMQDLAKSALPATAARLVTGIATGMTGSRGQGPDPDFVQWLDQNEGSRRVEMTAALREGLVEGRKLLIKTFTATRFSGSKRSRAVKKSLKASSREAQHTDGSDVDYYAVLKQRTAWLQKH